MSDNLIYVGAALVCSSAVLTNFRLYELDRYLSQNERELWDRVGFGNRNVGALTKLYRLRVFATEYDSEDKALSRKLRMFTILQIFAVVGFGILLAGVTRVLLNYG